MTNQPTPHESRQTEHTPTPWETIPDDAPYAPKTLVFAAGTETVVASTWDSAANGQTKEEAAANAAFIVEAANSHGAHLARIAALERALQAIADETQKHAEYNPVSDKTRLPIGYTKILNLACDALAPAAGKGEK